MIQPNVKVHEFDNLEFNLPRSITQELEYDTVTEVDPRYQQLHTLYAMRLKPLVKKVYSRLFSDQVFSTFDGTLPYDLNLNGTRYDTATYSGVAK